jgi:hypothetical protein
MAHCIVDLVDTGNTLKANGLIPLEHIEDISSRTIELNTIVNQCCVAFGFDVGNNVINGIDNFFV